MDSSSASDRFKDRVRSGVEVERRSASLIPPSVAPVELESEPVPQPQQDTGQTMQQLAETLQAQLDALPQIASYFQLRLEEDTITELKEFAKERELTPETIIDALWSHIRDKPRLLDMVVADAKVRYNKRKQLGKIRSALTRAKSLMSKNSSSKK